MTENQAKPKDEVLYKINKLLEVNHTMMKAQKEMMLLSKPIIKDEINLPILYGLLSLTKISNDAKIFILIYASSPQSIVGNYMKRGVRNIISSLYKCKSHTFISAKFARAKRRYIKDERFRNEIKLGLGIVCNYAEKKYQNKTRKTCRFE